jgi:hypothetical protein
VPVTEEISHSSPCPGCLSSFAVVDETVTRHLVFLRIGQSRTLNRVDLAHFCCEPPDFLSLQWQRWIQEVSRDCDWEGDDSVDDEEPPESQLMRW